MSPIFFVLSIWIKFDSRGPVFYRQIRVGKGGIDFKLFKFRTMYIDTDKGRLLTIGKRDPRITQAGYCLRRFKIDELPQLINVLIGHMSMVGPRPEVRKYVDLYDEFQLQVLNVRPGITDLASIIYVNENEILGNYENPEKAYIEIIIPDKIKLNLNYINNQTIKEYFKLLLLTLKRVIL